MTTNPYMKGLGFKRELPDIRDFAFQSSGIIKKVKTFPSNVDLRNHPDMPPVYDQKELGSCTAQAVGAMCDFEYGSANSYYPSRLFLYYVTRLIEGTINVDSGATIRNTIKATNEFGVSKEDTWPYDVAKFKTSPIKEAYDEALTYQSVQYKKVRQRLEDLKECIYLENLVAFGICVYEGLYKITKEEPILQMPDISQALLGGHALVLVGFDDKKECFIVRNSWGADWGECGYFYIPYEFVLNAQLSMDFWMISRMEQHDK